MKIKSIFAIFFAFIFYSCGPRVGKNEVIRENDVMKIMSQTSKINSDKSLKEERTEGALTDLDGFKDVGKFEYTTYFDKRKKELVKIENIEITTRKVLECYYFKNNELFCIQVYDPYDEKVQIGESLKMMIIIPGRSKESEHVKLLLEKAERFQKEFEKRH